MGRGCVCVFGFDLCVIEQTWNPDIAAATAAREDPVAAEGDALGLQAVTPEDASRVRDNQGSLIVVFWDKGDRVLLLLEKKPWMWNPTR